MKDPVSGRFYREQLVKSPKPDYKKDFFAVEKIVGKKKFKNKTFFLVKYLYYPDKFNQYIPEENMRYGKSE
jgi:AAA+ superfamily predicted ATPase